ncbi:MAG: peptidase S41, partial [Dysgonamonadaceae bacterium]|nr:peptidase S41 [Dysgonamonadaceae bacterium]
MNKTQTTKISRQAIVFIFIALIAGVFVGNFLSGLSIIPNHKNKIDVILNFIDREYVDDVDMKSLTENV